MGGGGIRKTVLTVDRDIQPGVVEDRHADVIEFPLKFSYTSLSVLHQQLMRCSPTDDDDDQLVKCFHEYDRGMDILF